MMYQHHQQKCFFMRKNGLLSDLWDFVSDFREIFQVCFGIINRVVSVIL